MTISHMKIEIYTEREPKIKFLAILTARGWVF